MATQPHQAYIIDAVRTPRGIGKQGKGALAHMHPQHLAATCLKAIATRNGLDTATVDDDSRARLTRALAFVRRSWTDGHLDIHLNVETRVAFIRDIETFIAS